MKSLLGSCLLAAAAVLAGCQSFPTDRIAAHQAEFNSWPVPVQQKVRAGLVETGFNRDQVFVALGEPNRKTIAGVPGNLSEIWVYHRRAARFSIGVGGGSYGRSSAAYGGVAVNGMKLGLDVDGQVIFTNGFVTNLQVFTR